MQTRNLLLSVVLCGVAHAAAAECVSHAQTAAQPGQEGLHKVALAETPKQQPAGPKNLGDMLIKSADARQPQPPGQVQTVALTRSVAAEPVPAEERRPRATTAMLLTALAVMFAIALRRGGAED